MRDLIRLARDAPARRPSISYPVSAARVTVDQHREELFAVQPIQDAAHQSRIVKVAAATDQNSHHPHSWIRNISINARGGTARLRARSPLNSDVAALDRSRRYSRPARGGGVSSLTPTLTPGAIRPALAPPASNCRVLISPPLSAAGSTEVAERDKAKQCHGCYAVTME